MAQPPGSDTLARPKRASSGPSTSTEARMVFTSSYGASGFSVSGAVKLMPPRSPWVSVATPMWSSRRRMVATSCKRGTFTRCTGCAVSKVAHICGKAAFLAPEIKTSPCRLCPPRMRSLSIFKR